MDVLNLKKEVLSASSPHSLSHTLAASLSLPASTPSSSSSLSFSSPLPTTLLPATPLSSSYTFSTPLSLASNASTVTSHCTTPRSHGTPKSSFTSSPLISNTSLPDTVNPASRIVHYTPKAAIFDFYSDVKMVVEPNGHEVVIGKCGTCSQTIRGSRNVTSNFVTHVKRLHPEQQSNWERKKAERHGYFTKNSPGNNFSNFYSTFTIPTQVKLETTPNTMFCYDTKSLSSNSSKVKLETTPSTMFCYDTKSYVSNSSQQQQPIVSTCYTGKDIVTQDSHLVTQDSTLTTTVKQEMDDVSRKFQESPSGASMASRVVSPDSVTDNEMWALLQAKQMLLFLVEQFLPLETADSPSLTTLLSRAPQKPYSSSILQNVLVPTCVSHVTSSITCSLQEVNSVNIVVTTQRKKNSLILFAVSVHYLDKSWKLSSHLLRVKYFSSAAQFERSFLDLLVKHNLQTKVFKILGTDMTNKTNFSVLNMPSDTCDINLKPVVLPKSLAGIEVETCDPLPDTANSMILSSLLNSDLAARVRTELTTSPHNFNVIYDNDMPKWSCEQSQITNSDLEALSEVLSTLEPFKEIFELLKTDQLLISVAIPSIMSLVKLLEQKAGTQLTSSLVESLRDYLNKINCKPLFRAATFLDPRFKLVWCCDKEEELSVVSQVRGMCLKDNEFLEKENMKMKAESPQPESKRIKLFTYFSSCEMASAMDEFRLLSPLDREIREYLRGTVSDETTNPLEYWRDNATTFKLLSEVAVKLLTVPIVQTKVQFHLAKFDKRIESLEEVSLTQTEEYLYLKVNEMLW